MDVQKKKGRQQFNFKHFALNATVLALLIFQAKVGRADDVSCPADITDASLAGQPCNFNINSSVTVENGGEVGRIIMDSYNPSASTIEINAGGLISNSTATGIKISNSSLTNGLINNGKIESQSIGIFVEDTGGSSVIDGGIANNGTITTTAGTSIEVLNSTVNGGISNSGTITAAGNFEGIAVLDGSTMNDGDITNTGVIRAANGILIRLSDIYGNVSNRGTIEGDAGIKLVNQAHVDGDLSNSGSIIATGDASIGISLTSSSEVSGTISNNGLISGGAVGLVLNSSTVGGGVSNSGTISGGNTGIAVLNTNHIAGGISNSGTIEGGTNAIHVDPSSSIDINIIGQHARVKGNVDATNSNFNITTGSTFTSEGTFDVKNFDIASNAIFNMAHTITAQNLVTNEGTLSVGNTSQTINGDGGYVQKTGGVFQTEITDGTQYGRLIVNHNVDLLESGNINVQLTSTSTIHSGEVFSNLISGETLTGPTDGFNVTANSFIWNFNASAATNDATAVDLTATINPTAYNACQGSYCQGAANTILGQVGAGNAAFDPYNSLTTEAAFKTAASQATPELTNENNQTLQFITRSIMDVVPMWGSLRGESGEDAMSYQAGNVWFKPYAGTMAQSENNSVPGFNATAYGVVVGRDTQLSDDWLIGGAVAAGKDNMYGTSELNGQSIHSDTYEGMLYGVKKLPHNLYLVGQGLVGYGYNTTSRAIPLYSSTADGTYNSWFANMGAQLGWHYALNQNLVLTPEFDVNYLFINQGGYNESGSPMDLSVNSQNNSSLILGAYGNAAYHLTTFKNEQELTLTGYVGIARDVLNNQPQTTASFVAGGPSFSTYGIQPNGFVFRGGTGLTYGSPTKPLSFNLNYDLQTGNNAYSGVGVLRVVYKMS